MVGLPGGLKREDAKRGEDHEEEKITINRQSLQRSA
jgi:hypothetical protein